MSVPTSISNLEGACNAGEGEGGGAQGGPGVQGTNEEARLLQEQRSPVWSSKLDFPASLLGFTMHYSVFWFFPYLCFMHGGVIVFMIPYLIFLVLGVIPLYYMELALGQHTGKGVIASWSSLNPILKGIGYSSVLMSFYMLLCGNVTLSLSFYYLALSFSPDLPWISCDNHWNTPNCYSFSDDVYKNSSHSASNSSNNHQSDYNNEWEYGRKASAAEEYLNRGLMKNLEYVDLFDFDVSSVRWQLAVCLIVVCICCFLILCKGIGVLGKVMWITALFPYPALLILFIRCVTLPGAIQGILYYLIPDFRHLITVKPWADAASYALFSLVPGFGVLITFSGYNRRNNRIYIDAIVTSACNAVTGFLAGFVFFAAIGYVSFASGKPVQEVILGGPKIAFVTFVDCLSSLPGSNFWLILFFLTTVCVGIDSTFGLAECIVRTVGDEFPITRRHRWATLLVLFTYSFLIGLIFCTEAGLLAIYLVDFYALTISLPFIALCEVLAVAWLYGAHRFSTDIRTMLGYRQPIEACWNICWQFITPISLAVTLILVFVRHVADHLEVSRYFEPPLATMLGACITLSTLACIPAFAIYEIITTYKGHIMQALRGHRAQNDVTTLQTYTVPTTTTTTGSEPVASEVAKGSS